MTASVERAKRLLEENNAAQAEMDEVRVPWKLISVVVLAIAGVIGGGTILAIGGDDSIQRAGVLFAFLGAIIGPLVAMQVQEVHKTVNSRLGQWRRENAAANAALLELTEKLATEQGERQGKAEERKNPTVSDG